MVSQITSLLIVYSTDRSGADQRKLQSSASLAFVRGIHWWLVNSLHKGPIPGNFFHLMTSSCYFFSMLNNYPKSKVHGANMGPIWGWQDTGGPHVGPINFAIWVIQKQGHLTQITTQWTSFHIQKPLAGDLRCHRCVHYDVNVMLITIKCRHNTVQYNMILPTGLHQASDWSVI